MNPQNTRERDERGGSLAHVDTTNEELSDDKMKSGRMEKGFIC